MTRAECSEQMPRGVASGFLRRPLPAFIYITHGTAVRFPEKTNIFGTRLKTPKTHLNKPAKYVIMSL